jgi:hypothetical protein
MPQCLWHHQHWLARRCKDGMLRFPGCLMNSGCWCWTSQLGSCAVSGADIHLWPFLDIRLFLTREAA